MTSRPASEPMVGPAGHPRNELPADFDAARRRLGRSARDAASRLETRLQRTVETYDLGRRELMAAQHQIRRLRRAGIVPSTTEYWQSTAVPRAEILVEASVDAVAEESDRLSEAIDHFLMAISRSTLEPWISGAEGRAAIQRSGAGAIDQLLAAVPPSDAIDELGEWWQTQLHRRALVRSVPRLLTSRSPAETIIGDVELELLDSSPWCYGDRLLSAFELAHAEIRSRADDLVQEMTARVLQRGEGTLVESRPNGPVVIKLGD